MRRTVGVALLTLFSLWTTAQAQDLLSRIRQMEAAGNTLAARTTLEEAIRDQRDNVAALTVYAEFLDRHGDGKARETYARLLERLPSGEQDRRAEIARRLVLLDLLAGDRNAAASHLAAYRAAGGSGLPGNVPQPTSTAPAPEPQYIEIPGPLNSFARMAAISDVLAPEQILPAVARNVITNGYRATASYEGLQQTEYLKLLIRYLSQARELQQLSGPDRQIRIEACESTETAELLRVLGYRMRGGCGSEVILETVNASRAFLTIDSGFPLAELEQALRTSRPFVHDFSPSRVPVLYGEAYWLTERDKKQGTFIDAFLADPALCRIYLAISKMDSDTADAMRANSSVEKLKAFAHVLDFFGSQFEIRDGKAIVPGGARSAAMWKELVGVSPDQGAEFYERLVAKDDGWMASYYDALRRVEGPVQDYLTEPKRLRRFYMAIRGKVTSPGPARPVFRSNADMMLLATRLRLDPDGRPHIPGDLDVWRRLFVQSPDEVYDRKLRQIAPGWKDADDVIEALFALCRKAVDNEPLKIYMAISDINRVRQTPLAPETVDRLARAWRDYGDQYPLFAETPALSDATIVMFLDKAAEIEEIGNRMQRADTAGTMQALASLWQIFVRNDSIPADKADATLAGILDKFGRLRNDRDLFDSALAGIRILMDATGARGGASAQDHFMNLLAGAAEPPDNEAHRRVVLEMSRIFESQKLVSLDSILDVANHLEELAGGGQLNSALINRLAARVEELRLHREGLSTIEKNAVSFGYWTERHIQEQRKMNLASDIRNAVGSPDRLRDLRASLTPVLRDTLVGFSYVHYAPPGAQLLLTNPLFVRSHDFLGIAGSRETWKEAEVYGTGWPSNAGGRLVGSLAGLPYALAQAEQNFLVPSSEQALIWADLVPQMLQSAKIPRWWNVTSAQMQWVALHLRYAESTLAESVLDQNRQSALLELLEGSASPARAKKVVGLISEGELSEALNQITPSEMYTMAISLLKDSPSTDVFSREIRRLSAVDPDRVNYEAVARAFGTPKPTLTNSYRPGLLHLRTFPTLMGYSSRIMAESWESNLLYFAALADEIYLRPAQLNLVVPEWTQKTVETIFATHLEDWPAVLRSLHAVGEEVRGESRKQWELTQQASLQ